MNLKWMTYFILGMFQLGTFEAMFECENDKVSFLGLKGEKNYLS